MQAFFYKPFEEFNDNRQKCLILSINAQYQAFLGSLPLLRAQQS